MAGWARASSLDRAIACPASVTLPREVDLPSSASVWGNTMHAWKETGRWPDGSVQYRRRAAALVAAGVTRESLWPDVACHEVSFALHTSNRLVAEYRSPDRAAREAWKASYGPEWVTGTADYYDPEGHLGEPWVDDLKTGREVAEDPWDLWQLRLYAVCAAMLSGAARVTVSITHWPRYPADEAPRPRAYRTVERSELLGLTLPLLETARRRALETPPQAVAGPQCRWCPSFNHCPLDPEVRTGYHTIRGNQTI